MDYKKVYKEWLDNDYIDEDIKKELKEIINNEKEIEDRFYKELEFGTAGLRGKIGAGTNRMNIYNISKVTQGLADYITEKGEEYINRGVAIAFDCRHYSKEFAKTAALVLAGNGIKSYLFEDLRPTPELSFAVRKLNTAAGIVITASHNPKDYNGYKVYWEDGAQVLSKIANGITEKIKSIGKFSDIKTISEEKALKSGLLNILGEDIDFEYIERVKSLSIREDIDKDIKVIYTPLNGTGNIPVRRVLKERGFTNIIVVPEQENPDPDFTTVGYPNPEDTKAFRYAENLGKKVDAELLIATDPDCDRLAIEVKDKNGEYLAFNGNQTGAILINYIVSNMKEMGKLPKGAAIVKSIVTGDLGKVIGEEYGVETYEALTGFKNICGKIPNLKEEGKEFIFGYEESIGYVTGTFVRDKDGVSSSMLLCEAAAYYKTKGKTLIDVLNEIYEKHGYYREKQISLILEGIEGKKRIDRMMESYRKSFPKEIAGAKLLTYIDYQDRIEYDIIKNDRKPCKIPRSNVLRFFLDDGSWYAVRPSGTEPKIKLYVYTKGKSIKAAEEKIKAIEKEVLDKLNSVK
ncbi:phosphoglucomutase [Clostridium botulinum]|uniref:Phosphoglucomutase n=2 Tax=Clostridium botulinum TaxID=1491 RepID=A5I7Z2_CLOBH|nr:phospho-sugar mutase [Clostridium botulinum]EKN39745.1 phosphoglucomutase [Clostridium botulinum CFSAN001627]ABS34122.1 phosphoglucomutase/phosphomannomutase family protein [Clostridium botulinum A str. ATCC 19397]ABS37688.1 phosphoglucomutase/phosphomannomutase family protein [Clostridium botulinum A str. Hall]APQ74206.1 phosphoglucomutase/phosphomannomutase, alpha/beta/alpha domain III family protein [Clostridium botulinum]APQ97636.1 phosphoglucomutase/phosphomannomutase, alpha/beta/alpha